MEKRKIHAYDGNRTLVVYFIPRHITQSEGSKKFATKSPFHFTTVSPIFKNKIANNLRHIILKLTSNLMLKFNIKSYCNDELKKVINMDVYSDYYNSNFSHYVKF
jgi:hypothetical protein